MPPCIGAGESKPLSLVTMTRSVAFFFELLMEQEFSHKLLGKRKKRGEGRGEGSEG